MDRRGEVSLLAGGAAAAALVGMISLLSSGAREWRGGLRTAAGLGRALAGNARPSGIRTAVYSIQVLARQHPDWYRADLATLLTLLSEGEITPQVAAAVHTLDQAPAALARLGAGGHPASRSSR